MSNNLLPEGYEWLQYIESTGTQWIDTGYVPNADTKWEFTFKPIGLGASRMGRHGEGQRFSIYYNIAGNVVELAIGDYYQLTTRSLEVDHLYNVELNGNGTGKISDIDYQWTLTPAGWTNQQTLYLFVRNIGTGVDDKAYIRLYNHVISENGTIIQHLLPAKNPSGVVGMYDTVTNTFFTNQGTGSFTPGPSADKKANYVIKSLLLPSEYQEVEYLQSDGDQYINTGVYLSNNSAYEIKALNLSTTQNNSRYLFGVGSDNARSMIAVGATQNNYLFDLYTNSYRVFSSVNAYDNLYHIHKVDKRDYYIDNTKIGTSTYTGSFTLSESAWLFSANNHSQSYLKTAWRISYCKIWDNNVLIRNFIPCKRKSDNKPGLYDLVTKQFFTNAATSGNDFTVGDNHNTTVQYMVKDLGSSLPSGYQELEYIQSDGNQYINTGITAANARGWKVTYEPTELVTSYRAIIGAGYNSNNKRNWVDDEIATGNPRCSITWNTWNDIPNVTIAKRVVKVNYKNDRSIYYNDSLITSNVGSLNLESDNYNLYIFAINGNGSRADWNAVAKLYDLEITENSNIIAHYIPAKRTSDSAIGLYDTVNNVFKENSGTGTFTAGPIKSTIIDLTIKDNPLLPAEYQQREYIESNKEQWIDTGIPATDTVGWKIDYAALSYDGSNVIIGAGKVSEGKRCWLKDAASNPDGTYYGWNIEPQSHCIDTSKSTSKRTIKINYKNNRKVYLNDVQKADLDTLTDININLFLFACNSDSIFGKSKSRLYDLEITSGGAVIRHFIPCVRISDTKPGLYDTIRGQFYTNLGTGTDFTPGPIKIN